MAQRHLLIGTVFDSDFDPQTTSIEFNGSDEAMRNNTQQSIGIANVWSIMAWVRRRGDTQGLTQINTILQMFGSGPPNRSRIFIRGLGATSNDPINVETTTNGGTVIKNYRWNATTFPFDVWFQMIVIWDGTDLLMYKDGALVARDSQTVDNPGSMSNNDRLVQIGQNGGVQPFSGHIHSFAVWDVDVSAGVSKIYNEGVASTRDLSVDVESYTFSANLQHWWRLGQDPDDLGKDSGVGVPNIDVNVNTLNIDATDISSESPK